MPRIARKPLLVLTILAAALIAPATASATDCGIPGSADASFTNTALEVQGDVAASRAGGYLQIPFDVPAGTTAIRVRYSYDQPGGGCGGSPNTLDMGVYDPRDPGETVFGADESRGWSGSAVKDLAIAQNGFSPESVYNASNAARKAFASTGTRLALTGRRDRRRDLGRRARARLYRPPTPTGSTTVRVETSTDTDWSNDPTPQWILGRPRVHLRQLVWATCTCGSRARQRTRHADAESLRRALAGGSGLDFVTLVDHNNQVQHDNLASYQAAHPGKLVIPGTEMTTYEVTSTTRAPFVDFAPARSCVVDGLTAYDARRR